MWGLFFVKRVEKMTDTATRKETTILQDASENE